MYEITLIATVHRERGICNSNELCKIIERLAPEIIFDEMSPDAFTKINERLNPETLEINAITRCSQKHPIVYIPVGRNELPDMRFKNDMNIHKYVGYTMAAIIVAHAGGALKHRFFDKPENDVLSKML